MLLTLLEATSGCLDVASLSRCFHAPVVPAPPDGGYASGPPFWIEQERMSTPRRQLAAIASGTEIHALGGVSSAEQSSSETYDLRKNTWAPGVSLPAVRSSHGGVRLADGSLAVVGGWDGTASLASTLWLAPNATTWTEGAALATARRGAAVTLDPCGALLAIGGEATAGQGVNTAETGTRDGWSSLPSLGFARIAPSAATDPTGQVYVLGGIVGADATRSVEAFGLSTRQWAKVPEMIESRGWASAVFGPDGRVYAIGGGRNFPGNSTDVLALMALTAVEAFSPRTQRWEPVSPLPVPSRGLAAVVGDDGRIYAVGGDNGNPISVNAAYGPAIRLSAVTGPPGTRPELTGSNFAANATVEIHWGDLGGPLLETGLTNALGELAPVAFVIPQSEVGPAQVTVLDLRSAYPVRARFEVTR